MLSGALAGQGRAKAAGKSMVEKVCTTMLRTVASRDAAFLCNMVAAVI